MAKEPSLTFGSSNTSIDLAHPEQVPTTRVIELINDWKHRVDMLYTGIERALVDTPFRVERKAIDMPNEAFLEHVAFPFGARPLINMLRIVNADGQTVATLKPRALWVIGGNGQVDLIIRPSIGSSEVYAVMDESERFKPSDWVRWPAGNPFDREVFDPAWLVSRLR
jgi:hypothetical protein